jgi:hypothetical protein
MEKMNKLIRVALLGSFGMMLPHLGGSAFGDTSPAHTSHYVRPATSKGPFKDRVIVFVHGVFSNADQAWKSSEGAYWPKLLLGDDAFDNSDVYVADYESPMRGNTLTVDEIVATLENRFADAGVFTKHREVVFVCHSLGGIVVQQLLLTFREHATQVPFIYFFAVPEEGSQIATLGRYFSSDPLLQALFHGDENGYLLSLENQWKAAHFLIKRFCAYETKPAWGTVLIVDRLSGTRNCDEPPIPINEDHFGIVKPSDRTSASYVAFRNAIKANPVAPRIEPNKSTIQIRPSYVYLTPTSGLIDCDRRAFVLKMVGPRALYNVDIALLDNQSRTREAKHYPEIDPGSNPELPFYIWHSPSSPWNENYTVNITSRDTRSVQNIVLLSMQKQVQFAADIFVDGKRIESCRDSGLPSSYAVGSDSHESCRRMMELPSDTLSKLDPIPHNYESADGTLTVTSMKTIPSPSELDEQSEDRHVTEYQRALFMEILGKFKKRRLLILFAGASKTLTYANEFREMFDTVGWNVQGPKPVPFGNEQMIDVQVGITAQITIVPPEATALLDFLDRAGVRHAKGLVLDPAISDDLLVLWVGPKGPSGSVPDDCLPPFLTQQPGEHHTCEMVRQAVCPLPDQPSEHFNVFMTNHPPL